MVSMLIGASCFAYGITNMCSLLYNLNHREVAYRDEVDELNDLTVGNRMSCIPGVAVCVCHHSPFSLGC